MDKNNKIASRVALGALFAYGNATIAPVLSDEDFENLTNWLEENINEHFS